MARMQKRFLDCDNLTIEQAEEYGTYLAETQRDLMWWIADLARYAESQWPDNHAQVWPEWVSPGMLARARGVGNAYPGVTDREADATYSQYMQVANKPDRLSLVADMASRGETSDESRKRRSEGDSRWMLAVDVNYFLHRFWFSGAGVEAGHGVASWIERTVARLKEKGLSDCVCCFDASTNHRKELTSNWDDKYKDRPEKDPELANQLQLVRDLLETAGFCCVSVQGMEADDVMASCAAQFPGRVTLLTQDKDCRQCLSRDCNMLIDVEWTEDPTSGDMQPVYKWLNAKQHAEETGITPMFWTQFQTIAGDSTDGIKGVPGIGTKGAADLVQQFGTVAAAIEAAKDGDGRIPPRKRQALIEFEPKLDITLKLVTLRTDLDIPTTTRV